jgi:hypothetical protein
MFWTTIRTITASTGDVGAPANLVGVLSSAPRCEVRLRGLTVTGSPTSIVVDVWRGSGATIEHAGKGIIPAADFAFPFPVISLWGDDALSVTVALVGGTSPTVSAIVEARPFYGGAAM